MAVPCILRRVALITGAAGLTQLSPNGKIPKWRIVYSVIIICSTFLLYPLEVIYSEDTSSLVEKITYQYVSFMSPFGIILAILNSLYYRKTFAKAVNALLLTSAQIQKLTDCEISVPLVKRSVLMMITFIVFGIGQIDAWDYIENALVTDFSTVYIFLSIFCMSSYVFTLEAALINLRRGFKRDCQNLEYLHVNIFLEKFQTVQDFFLSLVNVSGHSKNFPISYAVP